MQPGRLLPFILIGASIIGVALLIDFGLTWVVGPAPEWLRRAAVVNPDELELVASQLAAAEALLQPQGTEPEIQEDLAVLIGFSTAREGIDPAIFSSARGGGMRLLNLARSGGSFRALHAYFGRLFCHCRLRPRLLLMGIHSAWLAGRTLPAPTLPDAAELALTLRRLCPGRKALVEVRSLLKRLSFSWQNYGQIRIALRGALTGLRQELCTAEVLVPFPGDPFLPRDYYCSDKDPRANEEELSRQLSFWEEFGWFNPESYSMASEEARELSMLLGEAAGRARQTVALLLPESTAFRQRVPPKAAVLLQQILKGAGYPIEVIDLREELPEDCLYDNVHPNADGRTKLSIALALRLRSLLDQPSNR